MKLTTKKLKQMILEVMISPSTLIADALADPDVHPKIKDLLSTESEADTSSALELLATMYPDKYGTGNIEDKLQMGRQAYDQAVEAGMGDSFAKSSTDHVKLGTSKYARDFKDASDHRSNMLKNMLSEFYSVTKLPIKHLSTHYDPRFGGIFKVYTRGTSREDLKQIQSFKQYLAIQGRPGDRIEYDKYMYSFDVNL